MTAPPSSFPSAEYSYILDLVGTIHHQIGRLTEAVESLKEQSKEQGKELRDIGKDVHAAKFGLRIISAAFVVGGAVIGFLLNHLSALVQAYFAAAKK